MSADYFDPLARMLKDNGVFRPVMLIDRDRLDRNTDRMRAGLPAGAALRIVDKSLPCIPLIERLMTRTGTGRLMTFHLPVTLRMLAAFPQADLLFGKPMPSGAVRTALQRAEPGIRDGLVRRTVWLIDSEERLRAHAGIAEAAGATLRIAFEVDAGVRRGGVATPDTLSALLGLARRCTNLRIEGLMAYEAHIAEVPGPRREQALVSQRLDAFLDRLAPEERAIVNTGGSKTALLYGDDTRANDLSAGSGFLLPSDFDTPGLAGFEPAVFVATPVLKVAEARIPGPAALTRTLKGLGLFPRRCCYIYGGNWLAQPVHPPGVSENRIWGRSSNQQFLTIPAKLVMEPDDMVFFRPRQSEAILQHFGSIAVVSDGCIVDWWDPLPTG